MCICIYLIVFLSENVSFLYFHIIVSIFVDYISKIFKVLLFSFQFKASMFYRPHSTVIVPADPAISDDDMGDDDDVVDPDFVPGPLDLDSPGPSGASGSRKTSARPVFEELENEDTDEEEDVDDPQAEDLPAKRARKKKDSTTWKRVDITNPPLPTYEHESPIYLECPSQYFYKFFTPQLIKHITYQTNLYAVQRDVSTSFSTSDEEITKFVAILLYMGITQCPSLDDYWAMNTRVHQVADVMSSKRFRLLRRTIHFNDNANVAGTVDRFFKIRPIFTFLNAAFKSQPQTPKQSIDEVMVGYKGKTAGNLRQYIKTKPDKWGFKLFSRASEDGFIHDMVMYQGKTTLAAHGIPLSEEQEALGPTSQVVSVLASTMSCSTVNAIFADNYFTSLELVRYLKDQGWRYTGTARDNRIGHPPLKGIKDMEKKSVPRGASDFMSTDDGILALRWKDNKVVTLLSTDLGLEPLSKCMRYCKDTKKKEEVECPSVIKSYNASMGGIDKNDMLVHLYRTPMKSKRWYMRLFAYALDLCVVNAWLLYRRDCKALDESGLCLKDFRVQLFWFLSNQKPVILRPSRSSMSPQARTSSPSNSVEIPRPIRGHRSIVPDASVRFDKTMFHCPVHTSRQTCKHCSRQGHIVRSNIACKVCKVHLCCNSERNCFLVYHEAVA